MPSRSSPNPQASRTPGASGSPFDNSGRRRSGRSGEGDVVVDDSVRTDRHLARIRQIQTAEGYLVAPDLAQEVLEHLDGKLLAGAATIAEAERREPGVIADRQRLAINHAEHRAERAVRQGCIAAIADLQCRQVEWAF